MATIKTFNITAVELDRVKFDYSINGNTYTYRDSSTYKRVTEKRTETISWSFSTKGGSSIESPCSYTRGGSGETTYSLKATLTTNYTITKYGWVYSRTYDTKSEFEDLDDYIGESTKRVYTYLGLTEDETAYKYRVSVYTWSVTSQTSGTSSDSKDVNFYPHPANFTFKDCVPGEQWKVESGINSLITNITDFQGQAQQRKAWKYQRSQGKCPSFFNNDNIMTRNQMNAVYRYVKETGSNVEEFAKKDAKGNLIYHPISARMFNDLADIINEKT